MENQVPKHIGLIIDGNRRFSKRLMLKPWKGHEYGKEKVEQLLDYAKELEVSQLTFYCLSSENLKSRPENELNYLFKIIKSNNGDVLFGEYIPTLKNNIVSNFFPENNFNKVVGKNNYWY